MEEEGRRDSQPIVNRAVEGDGGVRDVSHERGVPIPEQNGVQDAKRRLSQGDVLDLWTGPPE